MTTNDRVCPTRLQAHPSTYSMVSDQRARSERPGLLMCLPEIPWAAEPHIGPADHTDAWRIAHAWFTGPVWGPLAHGCWKNTSTAGPRRLHLDVLDAHVLDLRV